MSGIIYLVSTPIGNSDDISLRALQVLNNVDIVVCEEYKIASALLKKHHILNKELINYNEHNRNQRKAELIELVKSGKSLALISDCGTPVFSDPGYDLVKEASRQKFKITAIPGASSLMTAISLSPIACDKFHFEGWLSQKKELRESRLLELKRISIPIIIMDTPYRLLALLHSIEKILGKQTEIFLACDLTLDSERLIYGNITQIIKDLEQNELKAEYILILQQKF
jgi:16S rRNA (cytidine1402-2'-O)-methyltransferase